MKFKYCKNKANLIFRYNDKTINLLNQKPREWLTLNVSAITKGEDILSYVNYFLREGKLEEISENEVMSLLMLEELKN